MKGAVRLTIMMAAVVIGSKLLFENVLGISLESVARSYLTNAGAGSAALIVALLAIDVLLPIPSSVVMVLSGAAFGVAGGSVLALVGSIGGEWLGFEVVRRYGRRASGAVIGDDELAEFQHFFDRHGVSAVILTRPLPVVMETMSMMAALSSMTRSQFVAASLAGTSPVVLLYAYAGAYSRQEGSIVPAAVVIALVTAAGWLWYRWRFRTR